MSTSTATHIETSSAGPGGLLRLGAAAAVGAALVAGFLTFGSGGFSPARPVIDQSDVAAVQADPFQVMADLTPVIAAEQARGAVNTDPFQIMTDLTPVVAAERARSGMNEDPFAGMMDLTPVISEMLLNAQG